MALSAFDDRSKPPSEEELVSMLGTSSPHWSALKSIIAADHAPVLEEWGFTSKSTGWGLRLKHGARTILYMTPCRGYFLVSFVLGEKAVQAAHGAGIGAATLAAIDGARKYAEGRGIRLEVRKAADLRDLKKIAAVKMAS